MVGMEIRDGQTKWIEFQCYKPFSPTLFILFYSTLGPRADAGRLQL